MTFICYSNKDIKEARNINSNLKAGGVKTWFDEEKIEPGEIWQDKLEVAIESVDSCMIIVGDSGIGPWQDIEKRAFINEFANRANRIIPVFISKKAVKPKLPLFLQQFQWIDIIENEQEKLDRLVKVLKS